MTSPQTKHTQVTLAHSPSIYSDSSTLLIEGDHVYIKGFSAPYRLVMIPVYIDGETKRAVALMNVVTGNTFAETVYVRPDQHTISAGMVIGESIPFAVIDKIQVNTVSNPLLDQ